MALYLVRGCYTVKAVLGNCFCARFTAQFGSTRRSCNSRSRTLALLRVHARQVVIVTTTSKEQTHAR